MPRFSILARTTLVLATMFVSFGCKSEPWRVNIAPGYSGHVTISCRPSSGIPQAIVVDSTGHVENATCPIHRTELLIIRDGKAVSTEDSIKWETTGDGIPRDIEFTIR
jgi:hypothetical protein